MGISVSGDLRQRFHELGPGDIVTGHLPGDFLSPAAVADLSARGVRCVPSILAQTLHRSKTAQAFILGRWMAPHTRIVRRRSDLMTALNHFSRGGMDVLVTKQEHKHCGQGVRRWDSPEHLYNVMAFEEAAFPFVVQPFLPEIIDVRVIMAGDYTEAYRRFNPDNFRMNLSVGGRETPYPVDDAMAAICRRAMRRGDFPYAHMDLHVTSDGACYLSEISLDGGIKGAQIDRKALDEKKRAVIAALTNDEISHALPAPDLNPAAAPC